MLQTGCLQWSSLNCAVTHLPLPHHSSKETKSVSFIGLCFQAAFPFFYFLLPCLLARKAKNPIAFMKVRKGEHECEGLRL